MSRQLSFDLCSTYKLFAYAGLVEYVERTINSEKSYSLNKPIYLVGESIGACLALAVAARNPDFDLVMILANPGLQQFILLCHEVVVLRKLLNYLFDSPLSISMLDLILQLRPS